ncbi:hypothetical protein [Microbacterium sp. KR10-403]|uniref:hypothetical protein n=1 Tax=Microbacterium sp. KR10-403 TaxID=3158581 RepID=UPI0032E52FB4
MKVQDLIDQLSDLNPEAELRIAYQPSWPMWESVTAAQAGTEEAQAINEDGLCSQCFASMDEHDDEECDGREEGVDVLTAEDAPAVYLVGGGSNHYASKSLWEGDGW